jgi:hypothetical protein
MKFKVGDILKYKYEKYDIIVVVKQINIKNNTYTHRFLKHSLYPNAINKDITLTSNILDKAYKKISNSELAKKLYEF